MVEVGFTPPEVTQMLPSTMKRFFTSWQRPHSFTTERSGSVPIRGVPSKCQPPLRIGLSTQILPAPGAVRFVFAPGQPPPSRTYNRLHDRGDAAAELKSIAAHEIAVGVGLIKFLAPEAQRRPMIAVERFIDIAIVQSVGMKHQVLADQPRRIGNAVGEFRRHRN